MKDMKRLLKYIGKYKGLLILALFFALIFVCCDVLIPYYSGKTIDILATFISSMIKGESTNGSEVFRSTFINCGIMAILVILLVSFNYVFDICIGLVTENITKDMKNDIFKKFNTVSVNYIDSHTHGDLISRLINDVDNVLTGINGCFKQFYQGVITICFTIGFMFWLNWILGLIVLCLTPFGFIVSYKVAKSVSKDYKKQAKIQGEVGAKILEDLNNINVIKSFNYENKSLNDFYEINDNLYVVGRKAQFSSSLINPSTRIINNTIYAILCIVGTILCVVANNKGGILLGATCSIGVITSFLQYANKFAKPLDEMSSCIGEIQQGYTSFKRINEVLNSEDDIDLDEKELNENVKEIGFNRVFFSYVKNRPLIEDFSLDVKKGTKVAIVGPTGCGKTTMINLIMRFYDPNSGCIEFNNESTLDFKKKEIRKHIGLVLQETWIFKGTVADNIRYSKKDATEEEIIEAAKEANAYSFISRLPEGFNTMISDDGGLSAGEKQLITIARVMLAKPEIVILDEATSNIDTRTEKKIVKAFNTLTEGRTSFVIAHRLSTIVNSDVIIVMKDGHIIETGNHNELMSKNGFYSKLFNAQFEN